MAVKRFDLPIDGLWTSGDTILRLEAIRAEIKFAQRPEQDEIKRFIHAMAELVETKLSSDTRLLNMDYKSVMPKRAYKIRIQDAGWTWSSDPTHAVSSVRRVEVEVLV